MLLIFDCDGVLVDSERLANATLAELMTSLGHPMTAQEAIGTFTGRSLSDVVTLAESLLGRPIPADIGERYGERLLTRFRSELAPVAGARAAIAALPYRKCVASSSTRERLALSLELTGLAPLFGQHVYSATQVARGKPAPDLFLFAARSVGETPSACIVIEDSVLGIEAALAAGMAMIGFAGASHATDDLAQCLAAAGASTVIRSMAELPAAVERLAGGNSRIPV
jgi:HAD superfamily hydrolase (TIGR01509 family)